MKKLSKIIIVFISILAVFGVVGGTTSATSDRNEAFLGDYIDYGIIANFVNETSDMETNFIVGKYQNNGHTNGNTVPGKANAVGKIKIGEYVCDVDSDDNAGQVAALLKSIRKDGNTGEYPEVTIDPSVADEVKAALDKIQRYGSTVLSQCDYTTPAEASDMNNYVIDVSDEKYGTVVYVNADNYVKLTKENKLANGALNIKIRKDQTVVFNISESEEVYLGRFNVDVVDGELAKDVLAQSIIFNMPNVNGLTLDVSTKQLTVIAPKAYVVLNSTAEGWLVCDTVASNNGEWHMIFQGIGKSKEETTPTPEVTKKPTPKATSTPTVTPTVTPTSTPTVTPTTSVTASPTPTTIADPTVVPITTITPTSTINATATPMIIPSAPTTENPSYELDDENKNNVSPTATPTASTNSNGKLGNENNSNVYSTLIPSTTPSPTNVSSSSVEEDVSNMNTENGDTTNLPTNKKIKTAPTVSPNKNITIINEDDEVPLSSTPETGDSTNVLVFALGMGISLLFIVLIILFFKSGE